MTVLAPYGSRSLAVSLAKAGNGKGGGKDMAPASLAARMPGADLAAKVGSEAIHGSGPQFRIVRRSAE